MELGKIQKAWVQSLRDNPNRQMKNGLGEGNTRNYSACCLGELLCVKNRLQKKKLPFRYNRLHDFYDENFLTNSYSKLGLFDYKGGFKDNFKINGLGSLAELNDGGYTWTQIADFVEKNPEKVFIKSF